MDRAPDLAPPAAASPGPDPLPAEPPGATHAAAAARVRFQRVAQAWAAAFALAGLAFLFLPGLVGGLFAQLAGRLQLGGRVDVRPGTLWHVLALSLMVSVTGLAWLCSRRPADPAPYRLLLAAKIASTLGFLWLAWQDGGVWLGAAATDGFVALSLWWARRPLADPAAAGLARRHHGQHPYYEVWFGKVDLGPDQALWFRYTLLDGKAQEASTWALVFDGDRIEAARTPHPLPAPDQGNTAAVRLGGSWLGPAGAAGRAGDISWDLRFADRGLRLDHVPAWMAAVGIAKSQLRSPLLDLRVSGTVQASGRTYQAQGAPGMVGHIHGSRSALGWAWAHCNHWDGGDNAVFEGLSARVAVAGRTLGPLTSLVLVLDGKTYRFSPASSAWTTRSGWQPGRWTFQARHGAVELTGTAHAPPPERIALVRYTDTDGSHQWCENSKLARLELRLRGPGVDRTLVAGRTAAFEVVGRTPPGRAETLR